MVHGQRTHEERTGFQAHHPLVGQAAAAPAPATNVLNNYLNLGATLPPALSNLQARFRRSGPNPTPAQVETMLTQSYDVLRVGGTQALAYVPQGGREPRDPAGTLRLRGGDCDELAATFLAAAVRLGIPLGGVRMAGIGFNSNQPGIPIVPHAVLFVGINGHNFIFDMTRDAPIPVRDFSEASIGAVYRGRSITYGQNQHSPNLTGVGRMTVMALADAVASQLLARADHFDTMAQAARGPARSALLGRAFSDLARAAELGSASQFIASRMREVATSVFDRTEALAEEEHKAGRYGSAVTEFRRALSLLTIVPSLRAIRGAREFDIRKSIAHACRNSGRYAEAVAEYEAMMRLRRSEGGAYLQAYNLNIVLYNRVRSKADRAAYLTRAYVIMRTAENNKSLDADTRSRITSQKSKLELSLTNLGVDPARVPLPRAP